MSELGICPYCASGSVERLPVVPEHRFFCAACGSCWTGVRYRLLQSVEGRK